MNRRDIKPMVVIFLDIDGVLYNNEKKGNLSADNAMKRHRELGIQGRITRNEWDESAAHLFDRQAINELDQLITTIELNFGPVGIVISSDWRRLRSTEELRELLKEHSFSQKIIDKTIDDSHALFNYLYSDLKRGEQIELWLQDNRHRFNIGNYIIIDDVDLSISPLFNQFIHCNNDRLFTSENRHAALYMLSKSNQDATVHEKVVLRNQLSIVVSDQKKKSTEVKHMRISENRRREFITLFAKKQFPEFKSESESVVKLIAEYDSLDTLHKMNVV